MMLFWGAWLSGWAALASGGPLEDRIEFPSWSPSGSVNWKW